MNQVGSENTSSRTEINNINNGNNRPRYPPHSSLRRREWIPRGGGGRGVGGSVDSAAVTVGAFVGEANVPYSSIPSGGPPQSHNSNSNNNRGGSFRRQQHHHQHNHVTRAVNQNNVGGGNRDRRRRDDRVSNGPEGGGGGGGGSSSLPQLVQEIQDKLLKGTIECMICYDMVRRSAPVWSCSSCFSIFHLNCIKKWARAPTSIDLSAEKNQGFNWRCPGCQSVQLTSYKDIRYLCFCGKRQEPPSDPYLTPHSCGEACGRPLDKDIRGSGSSDSDSEVVCRHRCVLQCHPGPCPPCKAFAPPRLCPCGKKTITTRCSQQKSLVTCGQICGKPLNCQRHSCGRTCHVGPCDSCEVRIDASCFCKKKSEVVVCGDMALKGPVNVENGIFSCSSPCEKSLVCGNHACKDTCHPGLCGECDLLPGRVKSCYCGKSSLLEERHSCLDPIPACSQICEKTLPCGLHLCKETCHPGSCAPCRVMVTQKCRCGSTSRVVECFNTTMEVDTFLCDKPCGRKKNCGRHRCSDKCCPFSNSNNAARRHLTQGWDPHLCSKPCEKKLRCGQHDCESLCHSGHCPPCQETIFTDLTCACGRSSIPPPLPCGTPPPSCQYPCSVPQPCGHMSSHSCHFGDCPPCSVPIPKECIGGHVVLRNIPCGSKDIRCNKICGKARHCGMHACLRTCHPSPCDSSSGGSISGVKASCGQTCGAPRRDCRHTCTSLCHPFNPCPDVRCEFPVTITCSCGRITATVPCDAGGNNSSYNADTVLEASAMYKLPVPLQPIEANGKKIPLGQRKLMCDDECSKMERKKVLADAFGVTTPNLDALHFGENSTVSEMLGDLYRRDAKWVLSVEERCKMLVLGRGRGGAGVLKVHVFCPMLKEKRDAVRLIAERWKLSISAAGWEPKRFIVVHVTPKSKAPSRILGAKGLNTSNLIHPPNFDPLVDMDPRLVVALFNLPGDADVSALILRFGGECELVWLNDKNALAVFSDPARAATAMRRLDHGSVYYGATIVGTNGASASIVGNAWGGGSGSTVATNPWKKAVVQEPSDAWSVGEELGNPEPSSWNVKETPVIMTTSANRWSILDSEVGRSNFTSQESRKVVASNVVSENNPGSSSNSGSNQDDVVDDWEKAYD
uniref:NF-X1-type zinc finger protein NFXL1 n=1 Tax=Erigeron canadensis TaxID=72917 RepID=UPI001CB89C16|nr:NF-X1-type zinc finger protein NFXL1 [Erigeron canadensis]